MSILWCGGEPLDFPLAPSGIMTDRGTGFRSAFARCAVTTFPRTLGAADYGVSNPIAGAPFSSVWLSFFMCHNADVRSTFSGYCALTDSAKTGIVAPGVWLYQTDNNGQVRLGWMDAFGNMTSLVQSSVPVVTTGTPVKFDIQFTGFGTASTTLVCYRGGVQFMYWQGDSSGWGLSLDSVGIGWYNFSGNNNPQQYTDTYGSSPLISEIIVADESTLSIQGVQSLWVMSADTTPNWGLSTAAGINKIRSSDSTCAAVSTTGEDLQTQIPPTAAGLYQVKAVRVAARAIQGSGSSVSNLKLGFNKASDSVYVQSNCVYSYTNISYNAPVTSGNLLVVGYVSRSYVGGVTISDTLGTTYTQVSLVTYNSGYQSIIMWYGIAPSTGVNVISFGNQQNNYTRSFCMEFNGVSASVDTVNQVFGGQGQSVSLVTTTKDLIVTVGTNTGGLNGWSSDNNEVNYTAFGQVGWMPIIRGDSDCLLVGFTVASPGAHSIYLSMYNDGNNGIYSVAFPITWPTGTVSVGSAQAVPTTQFGTVEEIFNSDPTNGGAAFGLNLNNYQLDIQSD